MILMRVRGHNNRRTCRGRNWADPWCIASLISLVLLIATEGIKRERGIRRHTLQISMPSSEPDDHHGLHAGFLTGGEKDLCSSAPCIQSRYPRVSKNKNRFDYQRAGAMILSFSVATVAPLILKASLPSAKSEGHGGGEEVPDTTQTEEDNWQQYRCWDEVDTDASHRKEEDDGFVPNFAETDTSEEYERLANEGVPSDYESPLESTGDDTPMQRVNKYLEEVGGFMGFLEQEGYPHEAVSTLAYVPSRKETAAWPKKRRDVLMDRWLVETAERCNLLDQIDPEVKGDLNLKDLYDPKRDEHKWMFPGYNFTADEEDDREAEEENLARLKALTIEERKDEKLAINETIGSFKEKVSLEEEINNKIDDLEIDGNNTMPSQYTEAVPSEKQKTKQEKDQEGKESSNELQILYDGSSPFYACIDHVKSEYSQRADGIYKRQTHRLRGLFRENHRVNYNEFDAMEWQEASACLLQGEDLVLVHNTVKEKTLGSLLSERGGRPQGGALMLTVRKHVDESPKDTIFRWFGRIARSLMRESFGREDLLRAVSTVTLSNRKNEYRISLAVREDYEENETLLCLLAQRMREIMQCNRAIAYISHQNFERFGPYGYSFRIAPAPVGSALAEAILNGSYVDAKKSAVRSCSAYYNDDDDASEEDY